MIVAISLTASNLAYADCPPALNLKIGTVVTDCDRIGLNLDTDAKIKKDLIESDYNKKIVEEQQKIIDLKDLSLKTSIERSQIWEIEAKRMETKYNDSQKSIGYPFYAGLAAGVVLMLASGYALGQVSRTTK